MRLFDLSTEDVRTADETKYDPEVLQFLLNYRKRNPRDQKDTDLVQYLVQQDRQSRDRARLRELEVLQKLYRPDSKYLKFR